MDKKFFALSFAFLYFISFAAAGNYYYADYDNTEYKEKVTTTKYFPQDHIVLSKTQYINYDDDDRHSTDFYRHGYTYRATTTYFDDHFKPYDQYHYNYQKDNYYDYDEGWRQDNYNRYSYKEDYYNKRDYYNYNRPRPDHYYRYVEYLGDYEEIECYHNPPKGQIFYRSCP